MLSIVGQMRVNPAYTCIELQCMCHLGLGLKESVKTMPEERGGLMEQHMLIIRTIYYCLYQVKAYQEDFEAERRDKERLSEEKQSAAIKYEAEKTSLKLQLDRCQNDLAHFTAEANRLAQQLKLKNQYEEERYRKHLESKVSRKQHVCGLSSSDETYRISSFRRCP